jgi:hypothetical protein
MEKTDKEKGLAILRFPANRTTKSNKKREMRVMSPPSGGFKITPPAFQFIFHWIPEKI